MTLEESIAVETQVDAARRQAQQALDSTTALAIELRTAEMRLATMRNSVSVALGYLKSGQLWAAEQVLESL